MGIPWRKDSELLEEANNSKRGVYENEIISLFGFQLGQNHELFKNVYLCFRSPNDFSDAILVNRDTHEVCNIEFEVIDSDFTKHGHDHTKCDLIVCYVKDENWKNPITVYELKSRTLYQPS